jgi:cholesterol oxidase
MAPLVTGGNLFSRLAKTVWEILRRPVVNFKMFTVDDWSRRTQILLFMRTMNDTLRFSRGIFGMKSKLDGGERPTAFIPEANSLAKRYSNIVGGNPAVLLSETVFGIPTTAHILGGATMGEDRESGVIDKDNRVFGYHNMYVCDGSMISANIGVNPSLTITALSERAMSKIPPRTQHDQTRQQEPVAVSS